MESIRSSICAESCRPPTTAAPVQIACPRMPPSVTPITSVEAASPIVAICHHNNSSSITWTSNGSSMSSIRLSNTPSLTARHSSCRGQLTGTVT